jgi:hypothetical protein
MDIQLAEQHIFRLNDRPSPEEIRQRAMDRRTGAFGGGLASMLGLLVPGGSIAVKVAKLAIDANQQRSSS